MSTETVSEAQMFAEDVRKRERRQRFLLPIWQILSFALHGLGFICLVLFTPLREIVIPEPKEAKSDPNLTAEQFEELAENVQTIRLNELMEQLNALQIILHNMDMMKNEMFEDYDAFAAAEKDNARVQVKDILERVVTEQEKALASQAEARNEVETIAKLQAENIADTNTTAKIAAALEAARPVFPSVDAAQANAQHLIDQATVQAEFAGLAKTAEIASTLRDVQLKANTMQREFQINLQNQVGAVVSQPKTLERIDSLEKTVQRVADELAATVKTEAEQKRKDAELKREVEKSEKQIPSLEAVVQKQKADEALKTEKAKAAATALEEARRALAEAERHRKAVETKQAADDAAKKAEALRKADEAVAKAREAAKLAQEAAKTAERTVKQEQSALEQKRREVKSNADALGRSEKQRKRLEEDLQLRKEELKVAKERKVDVEAMARKIPAVMPAAQRDAITAQEALVEKVKELAKLAEAEEAQQKPLAQPEFMPDPDSYKSVSELDLVEAYETAKQLEAKITESYREIKSAESAMVRKMSYQAASKLTDVAKVVRDEVDAELLRSEARDRETFDRQKAESTKAIAEADSMVETSKMLMTAAIEIAGPESPEHSAQQEKDDRLKRMYELAGMSAEMTAAAAESEEEKAKDLSQLMAQASLGGPSPEAEGGKEKDEEPKPLSGRPMVTGLKSPLPGILGEFSTKTPENVPGNIIKFAARADAAADGIPTKWMYVNSWYVIGPFPNPDRVNIRRRFAPETVVDLDATYLGKDNRVVKWQFDQALSSVTRPENRAYVVPSTSEQYGIWYAYTEVFVDQDCDVWIAVGSDDRSDLWINDLHVWGSSNALKIWSINEGFRKVRLNRGRNRFLARVENGWHSIGWSVCIALTDDVAL